MRKIKEVLRLKWACNLTHRQVQGALGVGLGTITQYLQLATAAGLDWAAAEPLEEDELERRILSPASSPAPAKRVEPDCNVIHRELRRKGVTLQLLLKFANSANVGRRKVVTKSEVMLSTPVFALANTVDTPSRIKGHQHHASGFTGLERTRIDKFNSR
jgi:hypothetical protein